ncbi:MAG: cyclic peptide export ABC transporter [Myxococcales bacterium]|nr:cyclic peptide export ABC transporter [Myxococcales bacterium]
MAVGDLLVLYGINEALDRYRADEPPIRELLLFVVGLGLGTTKFQTLLDHASLTMTRYSTRMTGRLFAKLQAVDLAQFEAIGSSEAMVRLTMDTARLSLVGLLLVHLFGSFNLVLLSLLYFRSAAPLAATLAFAAVFALTAFVFFRSRPIAALYERIIAHKTRLFTAVDGLISGLVQVKLHRRRRVALEAELRRQVDDVRASRDELSRRYFQTDALGRSLFFVLLGFVTFVLPTLVADVDGELDALIITILYIMRPTAMIVVSLPELNAATTALRRLERFERALDTQLQASPQDPGVAIPAELTPLVLEQVCYRYPASAGTRAFEIGPIDLEIEPGEIMFVTGANGSGKSTFLKVLTGLYPRSSGRIAAAGVELPELPPPTYRERFAAIFLDFVLFEHLHGREQTDPEAVHALLRRMQLTNKVDFSDGRFSTTELSTGQRKRLAMVIALLQDRPIYVFDEWAADQDPEYRADFYRTLLPELKRRGKTVIAVTHDEPYFDYADRRVHFEDGRLIEL